MWMVGNGRKIKVWEDSLLFDGGSPQLTTIRDEGSLHLRVCDLFME